MGKCSYVQRQSARTRSSLHNRAFAESDPSESVKSLRNRAFAESDPSESVKVDRLKATDRDRVDHFAHNIANISFGNTTIASNLPTLQSKFAQKEAVHATNHSEKMDKDR